MTDNTEQIRALIVAGKKATQGDWKYQGKDCNCGSCLCGYNVYAGDWNEKSNSEKTEDAQFITQAIAEMLEDNERMRAALEFYSYELCVDNPDYYSKKLVDDKGERARQALKGTDDV